MDSILFWMIFLQVSIFMIGAILVISWLVFEPRDSDTQICRLSSRGRCRPRRARIQEMPNASSNLPQEA